MTESLKALAITHKVLEFIVLDAQPISVVEDEGFRRLLEYSEPRCSLPSSIFPRPVYSLLLIQQWYRIGIGYRQIHKAQALLLVSGKSQISASLIVRLFVC